MHGSKNSIPTVFNYGGTVLKEGTFGEYNIGFESFRHSVDTSRLLTALPDHRCPSPHWGYVIKGAMNVHYDDGEEKVSAGEAYYLSPGHTIVMEAGTEIVEFSPKEVYSKTIEALPHHAK